MYVKNIQRKAIKAERENVKKDPHHLVLQIDFAENWAVIYNKAVQGNHWVYDQISIFTAVSYQGDSTQSFAVISDNRKHDSSYTLLAEKIITFLKENCCDSVRNVLREHARTAMPKGQFSNNLSQLRLAVARKSNFSPVVKPCPGLSISCFYTRCCQPKHAKEFSTFWHRCARSVPLRTTRSEELSVAQQRRWEVQEN